MLRMSLQQEVPSHMFTLPRVWEQVRRNTKASFLCCMTVVPPQRLASPVSNHVFRSSIDISAVSQMKKDSDFLKRREEVAAFNKRHKWLKRGISMTHCRSASCALCR